MSSLKTSGGAAWMVHVASTQRSCGSEAEDGRFDVVRCDAVEVRQKDTSIAVIYFSACKDILVF
jgi:hypothetical protein